MSKTIAVKLDVTKIEKERLYKGEKGTYLDAVILMNDEADQYGQNGMIVQSVSKEEREKGIKGNILGNVKILRQQTQDPAPKAANNEDDDLPF